MDSIDIPKKYISNIHIDGMSGRVLDLPAKNASKNKLLFVYGHHSSIERWWGLMLALSNYGSVTMPDLPGFGGMDSFYKIGKKPTIDNMADYLVKFIKKHFKDEEITIAGMSFGFAVTTRMLQRHPELHKQIKIVVSIVGFVNQEDFTLSPVRKQVYIQATRILSHKIPSILFRHIALHPVFLNAFYGKTHNAKNKFKEAGSKQEIDAIKAAEVTLWHINDVRTWCFTTVAILTLKNSKVKVDLPVWHVGVSEDHFFDNNKVEKHLSEIYKDVLHIKVDAKMHAPSVIADEKAAAEILPQDLRDRLSKL